MRDEIRDEEARPEVGERRHADHAVHDEHHDLKPARDRDALDHRRVVLRCPDALPRARVEELGRGDRDDEDDGRGQAVDRRRGRARRYDRAIGDGHVREDGDGDDHAHKEHGHPLDLVGQKGHRQTADCRVSQRDRRSADGRGHAVDAEQEARRVVDRGVLAGEQAEHVDHRDERDVHAHCRAKALEHKVSERDAAWEVAAHERRDDAEDDERDDGAHGVPGHTETSRRRANQRHGEYHPTSHTGHKVAQRQPERRLRVARSKVCIAVKMFGHVGLEDDQRRGGDENESGKDGDVPARLTDGHSVQKTRRGSVQKCRAKPTPAHLSC
mmetsp:Transcript_344/g.874  ORF Transcript_344/g.874 Transcript_344/m.874 type:complete len:327 (-) Transcript_344:13-993(-)